jgi:hypothetical protein
VVTPTETAGLIWEESSTAQAYGCLHCPTQIDPNRSTVQWYTAVHETWRGYGTCPDSVSPIFILGCHWQSLTRGFGIATEGTTHWKGVIFSMTLGRDEWAARPATRCHLQWTDEGVECSMFPTNSLPILNLIHGAPTALDYCHVMKLMPALVSIATSSTGLGIQILDT